jgi:NADH-quinone oxidoreductase subunit N
MGLDGAMVQMISHGLVSGALFLCVGVMYDRMHSREISAYGGVINTMPDLRRVHGAVRDGQRRPARHLRFRRRVPGDPRGFKASFWYALLAAITLILGAAYTLWLVKRVIFGPVANGLLVSYIGLEILSLSLYAMVAFDHDSARSAEAAMKYFVLGAIASGTLLYGMSLIYGITGTLQIAELQTAIAAKSEVVGLWVGLGFIVVGVAFKFGAVPFHMWVPDVYDGAPTPVTLYIGTAPKLGALALAVRLLLEGAEGLASLWEPMLAALAVLSLVLGNVAAIAQTNIRRMLAYSTISHVGFILLGLIAGSPAGVQAALFYTIVYVIMAAGAFGFLVMLGSRGQEVTELDDLRGLWERSPWFTLMMVLLMISMIGVPPLAGFYAKWWILAALLNAGYMGLAIVGVLTSVIGAWYYLRVIRLMLFDNGGTASTVGLPLDLRVVLSVNALLLLGIGLFPDRLLELCAHAAALI